MFLNCHTYYSLRYGTLSPDELVNLAVENGAQCVALTDINNSSAVFDFVKACNKQGIKPIVGIEFRNDENKLLYVGLAKNNTGFYQLNELLSVSNLNKMALPTEPPVLSDVVYVLPYGTNNSLFHRPDIYIGVAVPQLNRFSIHHSETHKSRTVVWHPVTFQQNGGYELHKHLVAINQNTLLSMLTDEDLAKHYEHFVQESLLKQKFEAFENIIENTIKLLDNCSFNADYSTNKNKHCFTGSAENDMALLTQLANEGMVYRYGSTNSEAIKRVDNELNVIKKLGFAAYFLITHDIVQWSLNQGYYHVGRGSGANSIVAYCLKITDVDPIELNLYFERFLNPLRSSPPDFDIDFSWKNRDAVHHYIFSKYGPRNAALLGATNTFRDKSMVRELGKVYGLPKAEIDALVDDRRTSDDRIKQKIVWLTTKIQDFPNLRTIHAGGVLISDEPITYYSALDMPPKGLPTVQWDMYVAEDIGFEKIDILSQRGIGHIRECVDIVKMNRGIDIDIHQIERFKQDKKSCDLLRRGETNGCFYIESPAMRGLLKKLKCNNYITLVAASSIIRPGVAKSGMMKAYIERFHNPDAIEYLHPVMKEQLEETYGVMVYQEDVLKVCHHFAGLDLADADILRRAMSGKFRSRVEFQRIIDRFFANCKQRGYDEQVVAEVWRQIESFAGYSFSKAHSASYAAESFQSLYLKAHYPIEFMVAVVNNFGGFFNAYVYLNEAKRWGATINLPCINRSNIETSVTGTNIFIGFNLIKNLQQSFMSVIVKERKANGLYQSLGDFIDRIRPDKEQMVLLIRCGVLRMLGENKPAILWEAHAILNPIKKTDSSPVLFREPIPRYSLPKLQHNMLEDAYDEIELLGFPVTLRVFDMLQTKFRGEIKACQLSNCIGQTVRMMGELVTIKYVRTVKHEIMNFGTFLDCQGEFFDTVHFPPTLSSYPFRGNGVYLILGKVVEEFGFASVEVIKMAKMPFVPDPRI